MRDELKQIVIALIERLARADRSSPAELCAELEPLLADSATTRLHVLGEWQPLHQRHDCDVLLRDAQLGGTLSLAVRRTDDMPWALLGVQRWRERDFVRVNGVTLTVQDVVAALDFIWSEVRIATRLVDLCLMRAELEREPILVSDDELQAGVDDFRQRHGLHSVEATLAWLAERGLSQEALERRVEDEVKLAKLAERTVGFDAWLADARRRAEIEWNWGEHEQSERTTRAVTK